jgi:two-component system sensor kinase ParS
MLRLFLGLFLVMTVGLVLALQTVDTPSTRCSTTRCRPTTVRRARAGVVTGRAHARSARRGREQQLEALRPHYGLSLKLIEADQLDLSTEEKAELAQNLLVIRDNYTQFISNIDGGSQPLSIKLPPEPSLMPFYIAVAMRCSRC